MNDPQLYCFSDGDRRNVIFGHKNALDHFWPNCITGYKASSTIDFSDNWVKQFVPMCDACVDRSCNVGYHIGDYSIRREDVEYAKALYYKKFLTDKEAPRC